MFAPQLATAQSKTAKSPAKSNARQRPEPVRRNLGLNAAERVQMLQWTIGNQAVLRLLAQEAANRAADRPADKGPGSGSSRSFARIPIFPHGQAEHQQQRLPLTALPFRGVIQTKLEIGAVNDPLEAEADRVAEQVMRTPDPVRRATPSEENVVRRICVACEENVSGQTCAACEAEEKKQEPPIKLSRKNSDGAAALDGTAAPSIVEEVLRSPGQPLATQDLDFSAPASAST